MAQMLSILLQRSDRSVPWGIELVGGRDGDTPVPLAIASVDAGTLAAHHLTPGDSVLFLQGRDAKHLRASEVQHLVRQAGRSLELLVAKAERPNTPVNVPETIILTPPPRDHQQGGDGPDPRRTPSPSPSAASRARASARTSDIVNQNAAIQKKLADKYIELRRNLRHQSPSRPRQGSALREDSWWIQDPEKETNVKPQQARLERLGKSSWPLRRRLQRGGELHDDETEHPEDQPLQVHTLPRRHKDRGEAISNNVLGESRTGWRKSADLIELQDQHQQHHQTFSWSEEGRSHRSPEHREHRHQEFGSGLEPTRIGSVSPFRQQCDKALSIIDKCRAQLLQPETSPYNHSNNDLIDLDTEIDPRYPWRRKRSSLPEPSHHQNGPSTGTRAAGVSDLPDGGRSADLSKSFWREFDERVERVERCGDGLLRQTSLPSPRPPDPPRRFSNMMSRKYSGEQWDYRPCGLFPAFPTCASDFHPCGSPDPEDPEDQQQPEPSPFRGRQSSNSSGGTSPGAGDAPPAPAPPPPPPPAPGGFIPSMRINSEIADCRGRSPKPCAPGEPPAAIQNAMMTKDKKPFTYTPGGLDLSQIRSPRIQRRINRNINDEGVGAPQQPQQERSPPHLSPAAQAAMQPNMQVQVLPAMPPPPPPPPPQSGGVSVPHPQHHPAAPAYAPPLGGAQAPVSAQAVQLTAANLRPTGIAPMRRDQHQPQQQNEPGSLYVAPVPVSATPAAPAAPRAQLGSLYIPPVDMVDSAGSPSSATPPPPPQRHFNPQSPQAGLNKAPTPWISSLHQQQAKQQPPSPQQLPPQQQGGSRIIPIQIEGREPPQPQPQVQLQQQRQMQPQSPQQDSNLAVWQQRQQQLRQQQAMPVANQQVPWRTVQSPTSPPPPSHQVPPGERVIPIQIEGATSATSASSPRHFQPQNSSEWGMGPPVQSQSFRVLQKITGTDRNDDDAPDASGSVPRNQQPGRQNDLNAAQLRKLQLNEDDRALMNKFKAQVDDEIYLHQESDPRYRGAAIPSRAFRMLQNMTGSDDGMAPLPSRISPAVRAAQQSVQESAAQPYIPPSEQTAPEPRKYTGGAIPSRSFRMLQAMTAGPGNCAMNPSANGRESPLSVSLQPVYDAYGAEYNPPPALPPAPDSSSNPTGYWELQTPEQQQQFWEHYNAMCAYMAEMNAALGYGPVPYPAGCHYPYDPYSHWGYHASDSEDCSGYSSTDEMSYYGANFARNGHEFHPYRHYAPQMPVPPSITVTPTTDPDTPTNEYQTASEDGKGDAFIDSYKGSEKRFLTDVPEEDSADDDSSETDTEKEDSTAGRRHSGPGNALQTIKSVPNVHVYSDSGDAMDSMTSETDDQTEDDYDGEDDVVIAPYPQEEDYPHQLSVILEESEASDAESLRKGRQKAESSSVAESSTATTNSECDSEEDLGDVEESTVMVRLPLRLKFSRSENDEEVTTVIVGDSQVRRTSISSVESPDLENVSNPLLVPDEVSRSNDDVSITVTISSRGSAAPSTPSERRGSFAKDPSVGRPITADDAIAKPETGRHYGDLARTEDDMGADVSVSVPVFRNRRKSTSVASPVENSSNTSEEEDRAKSNEESDYHWEDDSSSTSIQTVRGVAERAGTEHNSGSELEAAGTADELDDPVTLKKDPEETEEVEEVEDFEWGEDGTLRTIKVPRRSLDATDSVDEEGCAEEVEHQLSATVSEHSEGVPSDEDDMDMSSASSSDSSSSSSSTSKSESSNSSSGSASSRSRSNKSTSLSRDSTAAKCEVAAASQTSSIIEAESESEVQKPSNSDDESCGSTEVTEEESDDDGEELESDSKPEEVEKYVRTIMSNMKFMPVHPSNDDVEPPVIVATVNENHLVPIKTDSPDIPESTTNDKIDTSKGESEEDDSGVTSDMSRHISEGENEETSESHKPRKVSKYQRAQTHSRLFRLLQDESICSQTNGREENNEQSSNPGLEPQYDCPVGSLSSRKECLTLPLASNTISDPDSLSSSSGITSPASPTITDRLVKELVHTLLQRKKGRRLRKVPIAKLQAAALRILQEDMDPYDTLSSTSEEGSGHFFRSSIHSRVPPSNTAESDKSDKNVYGTNYLDYRNYYESWNTYYDKAGVDYDIMPSRAFKLLDQHAQPGGFSSGVIEGLWGKCPRERSSKTVNKDVSQNPTHDTPHDPSPQPNNTCTVASGREDK